MVLTASFELFLVIGLFCHHRWRGHPANLTPASRRQNHTTSPSAGNAFVDCAASVHRIPHPTFVTTAKRPSLIGRGTREEVPVICPSSQAHSLRHFGTTGKSMSRRENVSRVLWLEQMPSNCLQPIHSPHERKRYASICVPWPRISLRSSGLLCWLTRIASGDAIRPLPQGER